MGLAKQVFLLFKSHKMAARRQRQIILNAKPSSSAMEHDAVSSGVSAAYGIPWSSSPSCLSHPAGSIRIGLRYRICSVPSSALHTVTGGYRTPGTLTSQVPIATTGSSRSQRHMRSLVE